MFGAPKTGNREPSPYATKRNFCRIFEKDMNRLYLLSFLLTGDEAMAEQCFIGGLHIAQEGNLVFRESAESWARRTIILNAIRMVRPRFASDSTPVGLGRTSDDTVPVRSEIVAILELPAFERFVFVMSVLEGYSDQECSVDLSCTRNDVMAAGTRALERVGQSADFHKKLVSIASGKKAPGENSGLDPQLETISGLAVSA